MKNTYNQLFEDITVKCRRQHWFGPDSSSPLWRERVPADDPRRFGFVYPPASLTQLQQTEALLGFPLPPLLCSLYANIANGGFGPSGGLRGGWQGYGVLGHPPEDETIIGMYHFNTSNGTVDLSEQAMKQGGWELPYGVWPYRLLPICDLGCAEEVGVDAQEYMFVSAPLESEDNYWVCRLPWTLEEWLWRWIRNEDLIPRYFASAI
jgi:hypothetical protein